MVKRMNSCASLGLLMCMAFIVKQFKMRKRSKKAKKTEKGAKNECL